MLQGKTRLLGLGFQKLVGISPATLPSKLAPIRRDLGSWRHGTGDVELLAILELHQPTGALGLLGLLGLQSPRGQIGVERLAAAGLLWSLGLTGLGRALQIRIVQEGGQTDPPGGGIGGENRFGVDVVQGLVRHGIEV